VYLRAALIRLSEIICSDLEKMNSLINMFNEYYSKHYSGGMEQAGQKVIKHSCDFYGHSACLAHFNQSSLSIKKIN